MYIFPQENATCGYTAWAFHVCLNELHAEEHVWCICHISCSWLMHYVIHVCTVLAVLKCILIASNKHNISLLPTSNWSSPISLKRDQNVKYWTILLELSQLGSVLTTDICLEIYYIWIIQKVCKTENFVLFQNSYVCPSIHACMPAVTILFTNLTVQWRRDSCP